MPSLPTPTGPYLVSTLDLEVPVAQLDSYLSPSASSSSASQQQRGAARSFHAERYQVPSHGGGASPSRPALQLRTVRLTLYYPYALAGSPTSSGAPASGGTTTPATVAAKTGQVGWMGSTRLRMVEGLLKYAGLPKYLALPAVLPAYAAFFAKLPLARDQPLLDPSHLSVSPPVPTSSTSSSSSALATQQPPAPAARWPTALFSHGLGGTRTTYSAYCAQLASQGVVVGAIEHRDRSGPFSVVSQVLGPSASPGSGGERASEREAQEAHEKIEQAKRELHGDAKLREIKSVGSSSSSSSPSSYRGKVSVWEESVAYYTFEELLIPKPSPSPSPSSNESSGAEPDYLDAKSSFARMAWRRAQLALRRAEVHAAHRLLQAINAPLPPSASSSSASASASGGTGTTVALPESDSQGKAGREGGGQGAREGEEAIHPLLHYSAPFVHSGEGAGARLAQWAGKLRVTAAPRAASTGGSRASVAKGEAAAAGAAAKAGEGKGGEAGGEAEAETIFLAHSFGGATAIDLLLKSAAAPARQVGRGEHAQADEETEAEGEEERSNPFAKAVLLDPWLEPLQEDNGGVLRRGSALPVPVYVINSQAFTIWPKHVELLRTVVQATRDEHKHLSASASSWLMTLTGTKHTDFSDFPFLLARMFRSQVDPALAIRFYAEWSRRVVFGDDDDAHDGASAALSGAASGSQSEPHPSSSPLPIGHEGSMRLAGEGEADDIIPFRHENPGEIQAKDLGDKAGVGIWHVPQLCSASSKGPATNGNANGNGNGRAAL